MRAIILAAGMGWRLGEGSPPKSLYEFGGKSLLRRHVGYLQAAGVTEIVIGVGYRRHLVEAELEALPGSSRIQVVYNPDYQEGNIVTLWRARDYFDCGDDVILMDADILYDARLLSRLLDSTHSSCLLLDRDCELDNEPVKVCVNNGVIVDFAKEPELSIEPDFIGESVGFFKLSAVVAHRLRETVDALVDGGEREILYEEAIRRMILSQAEPVLGFEDVTGLPWIEIDFHSDLERARRSILPRLVEAKTSDNAA